MKHMAKIVLSASLAISVAAASFGFQGASPATPKPAPKGTVKMQAAAKKAPAKKAAMPKASHHKSLPTKGTAKHKTHLKPHGKRGAKATTVRSAAQPTMAKVKSANTIKARTAKAVAKTTRKGTVQKK